jgi:ATP-binding cassette subfamily B protein
MTPLRQLAVFLKPYRRDAILAPLLMVLEVAMDLMQPLLLKRIIDVGIATGSTTVVFRSGLLMAGCALLGAAGGVGCTIFAVRAAMNYGADLRAALYRKVQSLSFGNLDRLGTGHLVTRLTNDVTQVQDLVLMSLRILVRAPLLAVGSIIMATLVSPGLAPLLLFLVPAVTFILAVVIRRSWPLFFRVQDSLDLLNTTTQENLAGVRVVKAFVRGDHEQMRFARANEALRMNSVQAMQFSSLVGPLMMLILNFGIAAAVWFGGVRVDRGAMTVGEVVAFISYLRPLMFSLMGVSMLMIQISRAMASASRVTEVFDTAADVRDAPAAAPAFAPAGAIAFEHVTFSYDRGEPVLYDVSFTAEPGQTVAILGATGSGKSSLVSLIPRFYDVTAGRVTVGGVDVRELNQETLRARIGVAMQEAVLFSGTIAENLHHGRLTASGEELREAAAAAQADEFIRAIPEGYDAVLGQRGVNLSGGQKQRLAIARALARDPDILILDDSTSAVDVETEARLQAALDARMTGPQARIVVAQRISTVLRADKILVLDDGQLVAEGIHAELLQSSPIYREIYESQLGGGVAGWNTPARSAQPGRAKARSVAKDAKHEGREDEMAHDE